MGNFTTHEIAQRIISLTDTLLKFINDAEVGIIEVY